MAVENKEVHVYPARASLMSPSPSPSLASLHHEPRSISGTPLGTPRSFQSICSPARKEFPGQVQPSSVSTVPSKKLPPSLGPAGTPVSTPSRGPLQQLPLQRVVNVRPNKKELVKPASTTIRQPSHQCAPRSHAPLGGPSTAKANLPTERGSTQQPRAPKAHGTPPRLKTTAPRPRNASPKQSPGTPVRNQSEVSPCSRSERSLRSFSFSLDSPRPRSPTQHLRKKQPMGAKDSSQKPTNSPQRSVSTVLSPQRSVYLSPSRASSMVRISTPCPDAASRSLNHIIKTCHATPTRQPKTDSRVLKDVEVSQLQVYRLQFMTKRLREAKGPEIHRASSALRQLTCDAEESGLLREGHEKQMILLQASITEAQDLVNQTSEFTTALAKIVEEVVQQHQLATDNLLAESCNIHEASAITEILQKAVPVLSKLIHESDSTDGVGISGDSLSQVAPIVRALEKELDEVNASMTVIRSLSTAVASKQTYLKQIQTAKRLFS